VSDSERLVTSALADAARRDVSAKLLFGERSQIDQISRNPETTLNNRQSVTRSAREYGYFIGPWYRINMYVLRDAVRADVSGLGICFGPFWIVVPVPVRLLRSIHRRFRPLVAGLRPISASAREPISMYIHKGRRSLADLLLRMRPTANELAIRIAGTTSFVEADLQYVFEAMIQNSASSHHAVSRRIVHVCGSLQPGGAERQLVYTLRGLAQLNIESVQLLCHFLNRSGERDFYKSAIDAAGINVREIRRWSGRHDFNGMPTPLRSIIRALPPGLAADIYNLYLEFIELRPEIVHAWLDWDNVRAGLAAVLAGVPKVILSGRNLSPKHFELYQPYMDPAYRALAKVSNITLINNSRAGADDYADWIGVPRDMIGVVYNAVDFGSRSRLIGNAARTLRSSLGVSPAAFLVGGVFRLCEEKRPLLWIETAQVVAGRVPESQFIIFGTGPMLRQVEQKIDQVGLSDRVILAGVTSDILPVMSIMDALLLTSFGEGLPNVLLEAQWVGTPVVATAVGGVKEAIEDGATGWALESVSPQYLADRLIWLHAHPEARADVLRRAPLFVREKFGLERMIGDVAEIYGLAADPMKLTARNSSGQP